MATTSTYEDLLAACSQEGCPICRLEHAADMRYLDRLFYELVNDLAIRQQIRASQGFCLEHARQATEELKGQALGLAIIYEDLLRIAVEEIDSGRAGAAPVRKCPACLNREENTSHVMAELSKEILRDPLHKALQGSQGLCFGHLRQALEHLRAADKRRALLASQRAIIEKLRAELAEYIRKNDYRFSGEPFGPERDSWRRAVRLGRR